jgi:alpha-L-rhamnosidase
VRTNEPWDLRVEHLDDAFGIDVLEPRLSWKLPRGTIRQRAYRVRAGGWDSGVVDSDASTLVPYAGPPLASRQRVDWQVKVWTDVGESAWSRLSSWEMGLLGRDDWTAQWIAPAEPDGVAEPGHRPAYVLRTAFEHHDHDTKVARLYATAHGLYECFINGLRAGDLELTPGFTGYYHRLQVQTYDVAHLLRPGTNELRVVLSDGWFRGLIGATREHDVWGKELALLAQLEADGEVVACTDQQWTAAPSALLEADLIQGQRTDLRIGDADRSWSAVETRDFDFEPMCASTAPPVRRVETIRPHRVTRLDHDRQVVDLGQNINGWLRLTDLGPRGTTLTITHGEALDETGDVTMTHLAPVHWSTQELLDPGQVDVVVSDGTAATFEPRHTVHGFQYARIEGHPGNLTEDDVTGVVVHTDMRRTGWFRCSDARLNRLHDAAVWSFRTNACDIPTDCPQRERAGWTGDWQLFAPTAAFLFDVAGFSTKWLRDLAADQRADGAVRNFAPDPAPPGADDHPIKTFLEASAGWGDAAVLVPWAMWRAYGDRRLLEEQWPSMVAWVEFQAGTARTARHQSRIDLSATPRPHEEYLWDTGFHWGEWTEPDVDGSEHFNDLGRDFAIIATAYFARSAATLAKLARVVGRADDADHYSELGRNATNAWRIEFVDDDGNVRSGRQADLVRALAFGLMPDELRPQTASRLVDMVRAAGTHLNTGFLATPFLLPALADTGHLDLAYELLFQDTPPSWLTMVDRGATTIWENWDGIQEDGTPIGSLNHYSKGAVVSFLHEYVAGLRVLDDGPAYRRFEIAPMPGGDLTWAEGAHESPYGRIASSWSIAGGDLRLVVEVPPGTTAEVRLPDGSAATTGPGTAIFSCTVRALDGRRNGVDHRCAL